MYPIMMEKKRIGTGMQKPTTASLLDDMEKRIGNLLREEKSEKPQTVESILETVDELMAIVSKSKDKLQRRLLEARCAELLDLAAKMKAKKKGRAVRFQNIEKPAEKPIGAANTRQLETSPAEATTKPPTDKLQRSAPTLSPKPSESRSVSTLEKLSTKEKIILFKSSRLGEFNAPPWEKEPAESEFVGEPFTDPVGMLHLSDRQKRKLDCWKRSSPTTVTKAGSVKTSLDLAQEAITDCSVVASMCVAFNMEERGFPKILSNRVYPQDSNGNPIPSANGKYVVKLFLNGCSRKVVIDDFLPESIPDSKALHVVCRSDPTIVWPALIEKAYLKVGGGYDFPGSNCAMDLYALTGWFPEQIHLKPQTGEKDKVFQRELWALVYKNWVKGSVLMTLGTGHMHKHDADDLGLVPFHDYAVLDMKEDPVTRIRWLFVKNPWSEGPIWRRFLKDDTDQSSSSDGDFDAASDSDDSSEQVPKAARKSKADGESSGTFWIDLNSLFINFSSVYLNWNPKNFDYHQNIHFTWNIADRNSNTTFLDHPQFAVQNQSDISVPVWVLLERHDRQRMRHLTQEDPWGNKTEDPKRYISLYYYRDSGGKRVFLRQEATKKLPFVDTYQTLLRIKEVLPGEQVTVVVDIDNFPPEEVSFSLTAFSLMPIGLSHAEDEYKYETRVNGEWTELTAGGNTESVRFSYNPQYNLQLTRDTPDNIGTNVCVVLESSEKLPINAVLLWNNGKRSFSIDTRSILGKFTNYERGFSVSRLPILPVPGNYTIVAGSYGMDHKGPFTLTVKANSTVKVSPIPQDEEGKTKVMRFGGWRDCARIEYPISVKKPTRISASACFRGPGSDSNPRPAMKIAVELRRPPNGAYERIACSGGDKFTALPQGVQTGEFTLEEDTMAWIVLQRPGENRSPMSFQLIVLSDGPVTFSDPIHNFN